MPMPLHTYLHDVFGSMTRVLWKSLDCVPSDPATHFLSCSNSFYTRLSSFSSPLTSSSTPAVPIDLSCLWLSCLFLVILLYSFFCTSFHLRDHRGASVPAVGTIMFCV